MYKLSFLLAFVFIFQMGKSQDLNYAVLEESLIKQIEDPDYANYSIYILLEDKIDLDSLSQAFKNQKLSNASIASRTIKTLKHKAKETQQGLIDELLASKHVDNSSLKNFWICNSIFFDCDLAFLKKLSNDDRVAWIGIDAELQLVESNSNVPAPTFAASMEDSVEPGLVAINAPAMWELGYTGYGQLALVADTGIDPTHPAFSDRYLGNIKEDSEAWFQGDFYDSETPFACGDHGTHVLGTVMGLDRISGDTIGVAYNAQWMGSPNLCGGGTASNLATFEWGADPDGDPNTVDDMADIINNSWWDPGISNAECNSMYIDVLEALELMGVAVIFSAGNAGPEPMTITPPHNINIDELNSFTVAAVQWWDDYEAADFSSRGPSQCGGEGSVLIKPEVAAPGVSVRSAIFEKEYGNKSGTSMAAPHVSGAILLLKEAFPFLIGRDFKEALYYSCFDLGEEGEDNTYGQGLIDVRAAYDYLIDAGHQPVPPVKENDVVLLEISTSKFECDGMLSPEIIFFNDMSDTLTSLNIEFYVDEDIDNKFVFEWKGNLAPHKSDTLVIPGFEAEEGIHTMTTTLSAPNGLIDSRQLNNKINRSVFVSQNEQLKASAFASSEPCIEANVLLQSEYGGDGEIHWFDQQERGNLLGVGDQLSLVAQATSTTVWGDINRTKFVGPLNDNFGDKDMINRIGRGLVFNANHPFIIESFRFYSEETGNVIFYLEDGNGDQLYNGILRSDGSGWQVFDKKIKVPVSNGLSLIYGDGQIDLRYNRNGAFYPYEVEDVMTIVGPSAQDPGRYYYFYDFKISHLDVCGRTPVEIKGVETAENPISDFSMSTNELNLSDSNEVMFSDSSINAISWLWNFGDGQTSVEQNPSHVYEEPGIYYISLLVKNEADCYDAKVKTLEVSLENLSSIRTNNTFEQFIDIFPNPFNEKVNISIDQHLIVEKLEVYDLNGKLIKAFPQILNQSALDFSKIELLSGMYLLRFYTNQGMVVKKLIKR